MNKKLEKNMKDYWSIGKIAGVLFTLYNYKWWTEPFNIIYAVAIIIVSAIFIFIFFNILDIVVGLIVKGVRAIKRHFYNKKLLKGFCSTENEGGLE